MPLFKPKKRSGGNFYQAVGNYEGIRVRHSLGTSDYGLARELCSQYEHKVLTGQVKVGVQRSLLGAQNKYKTVSARYLKSPNTGKQEYALVHISSRKILGRLSNQQYRFE